MGKKTGRGKTAINDCKIINLPKVLDCRGNLTFIENGRHIPFTMKRIFYIYDVPGGSARGGHANIKLHQLLIAMSGSFDVHLDDGQNKKTFHLNRPYYGLYIPPMIWREMDNFSSGSVCMVVGSDFFSKEDYYRSYRKFLKALKI